MSLSDQPPYLSVCEGAPDPLGATFDGVGVNFAVFSAEAEKIELCLFSENGRKETARIPMPGRTGDIRHVYVRGLTPGAKYGLRAHGPYAPEVGLRFNPHKLLIDPYARKLFGRVIWSDALLGFRAGSPKADLSFDSRDSARCVPKCVVTEPLAPYDSPRPPRPTTPLHYEVHVKGATALRQDVDPAARGKFLGLSSDPMLEHLTRIGVTSVQIMPVQAFVDERFLIDKGLRNYWGYQTLGFFAPTQRYFSSAGGGLWEFQTMVRRFHQAGIEVILDVVYNHTAEGSELGPTLCFRGLDNRSYYRLAGGQRHYNNDAGTGNTLDVSHPMALRMIMDSLRYWVEIMGVDGFRFDLATVLGRTEHGFDRRAAFFQAIQQDPVLRNVKMIAEPWDIGLGGYQLGAYPHPFLELNDKFRDGARQFWRGDTLMTPDLSRRLLGSADEFDHSGRSALSSVNFITSHDGFTLADLVSYAHKHNAANGEDDVDGHNANFSDNMGVEGPSDNPKITAARALRMRNLLATLFLSQGTPMLLAGDEMGNTQGGNNNAYAQDNAVSWLNWETADAQLTAFTARLSELRRAFPVLSQRRFLHGRARPDGQPDLEWRLPNGAAPAPHDWSDPSWRALCAVIRPCAEDSAFSDANQTLMCVFNTGDAVDVALPDPGDKRWVWRLDTARPDAAEESVSKPTFLAPAHSVHMLALQ